MHFYNNAFSSDFLELDMYSQNYVSASGSTAVGLAFNKNGAVPASNNTDMGFSNAVIGEWLGGGGTNVPKVGYTNLTDYYNAATGSAVVNPLGVMGFSCVVSLGGGCSNLDDPTLSFYYDSFGGSLRTQVATATPTITPGGNTGRPDIFLSTNSSSTISVSFYYYITDPLANINDVMPSTSFGAVVGPPPINTGGQCCQVSLSKHNYDLYLKQFLVQWNLYNDQKHLHKLPLRLDNDNDRDDALHWYRTRDSIPSWIM